MLCKKSFLGLALFGVVAAACDNSSSKKENSPWPEKTTTATESCDGFGVLRDMALTGEYLYNMVRCGSNRTTAGGESLDNIINLVNELKPEGIQSLLDFVLQPAPAGTDNESMYPYLTVLSTVMQRGAADTKGSLTLVDQRFGPMQSFLESLDPHRVFHLVLHWQESGALDEMLTHLHSLLLSLKDNSLSGLTQEFLVGNTIRPFLIPALGEGLRNQQLSSGLEDLFTLEKTISVAPSARSSILAAAADSSLAFSNPDLDEEGKPQTGHDRITRLINTFLQYTFRRTLSPVAGLRSPHFHWAYSH